MNLSKIHHIAIIVSDYEASKDFYVNKLGFSVIRENYRPERKDWKLDLRVNEYTELEIFAEENPPKRVNRPEACGLRHLAFCVESVEQTVNELAEVGIECEPIRVDDYTGKKMTFFHDPKRAYKSRKSGGGRKKLKPEYDAGKNLKEQMESAVALYDSEMSLQAIGEELGLNPIKVRKLLITAGVYESEVAEKVQATFQEYRETQDYKTSILSTANTLKLSKASVTSYLPYRKGVYFTSTAEKGKISVGAERQRRYRAMKRWRDEPTEENFWGVVLAYTGVKFKTYSGLPFSYEIKKGRNGEYTKELWIDRREKSKSLAWSSVLLALKNIKEEVVERPKALGDIRGVTYIYGMFYRFGLIDVPDEVKEKMGHPKKRKK